MSKPGSTDGDKTNLGSTPPAVELDDDFKQFVEALLEKHHVPAMSVAVIDGGHVTASGYGMARLPDVPATAETLYYTASTTKAFTAATMGILIHDPTKAKTLPQNQQLQWNTPLTQLLPDDFVLSDDYITKNASIEDALSHRSSLPGHEECYGLWLGEKPKAVTRLLRFLGPIKTPFRTVFEYNNLMYTVVSQVVEQLSGMEFGKALKAWIWDPLGMKSTFWTLDDVRKAGKETNLARGYRWIENEKAKASKDATAAGYYVSEPYLDITPIAAAGATISTVRDYSKWALAILEASKVPKSNDEPDKASNDSSTAAAPVISHSLYKDLTTPRTIITPALNWYPDIFPLPANEQVIPETYALGWFSAPWTFPGTTVFGHAGGITGFGANVCIAPNLDFAVVSVGNTCGTANYINELLTKELLGRKLGIPKEERRPKDPNQEPSHSSQTAIVPGEEYTGPEKQEQILSQDVGEKKSVAVTDYDYESLTGTWEHGAYGTFEVSLVPASECALDVANPTFEGLRLMRTTPQPETNDKTRDSDRAPSSILCVRPQGHRSWKVAYLLHPTAQAGRSDDAETPKGERPGQVFFDFERLSAYGHLSADAVKGFAEGRGNAADPKYPCKDETGWEGRPIISYGAAFDTGTPRRMGLALSRLAMEQAMEAAKERGTTGKVDDRPVEGWADGMEWFEKIGE